ncbi:hypothetical protein CLV35_3277 [Motilibacter peucedani]|uniref:Uncharacterized protein n=1 Tax=Motilibacter peucedani TaxID=598650 RepID=A0A420XM50_9ACTN|nr:hypothetical protein [Motilibacter peucedani]RKS71479.1 hypothetical protein CLV35_3277 [Motilibacter peucedani]
MSRELRALLVLGGPRLVRGPLLEAVERLGNAGWRVDVVCWRGLDDELRETVALTGGEVVLPGALAPAAAPGRTRLPQGRMVRGLQRRWDRLARAAAARVPPSLGYARLVRGDLDARRLCDACDVAVAVDRDAALAVWLLARRRPDLTALSGVAALPRLLSSSLRTR